MKKSDPGEGERRWGNGGHQIPIKPRCPKAAQPVRRKANRPHSQAQNIDGGGRGVCRKVNRTQPRAGNWLVSFRPVSHISSGDAGRPRPLAGGGVLLRAGRGER